MGIIIFCESKYAQVYFKEKESVKRWQFNSCWTDDPTISVYLPNEVNAIICTVTNDSNEYTSIIYYDIFKYLRPEVGDRWLF